MIYCGGMDMCGSIKQKPEKRNFQAFEIAVIGQLNTQICYVLFNFLIQFFFHFGVL